MLAIVARTAVAVAAIVAIKKLGDRQLNRAAIDALKRTNSVFVAEGAVFAHLNRDNPVMEQPSIIITPKGWVLVGNLVDTVDRAHAGGITINSTDPSFDPMPHLDELTCRLVSLHGVRLSPATVAALRTVTGQQ